MKYSYYRLLLLLFICLAQNILVGQSREISIQPNYTMSFEGYGIGLSLDYITPMNARNDISVSLSYLFGKRKGNLAFPVPGNKLRSIALKKRHRTSNRRDRRFFYEYGLAITQKTVQHPVFSLPMFIFCGTGVSEEDYILVSMGTPTYQMQIGATSSVQYDFRIGKHLFLGGKLGVEFHYDFYEREANPLLRSELRFSYEF